MGRTAEVQIAYARTVEGWRGTAAVSDDEEFARLTHPFRRELLAHCYRMLGSVHDAEDLVQETYLRAWRAFEGFEGRSSLRVWLYRIATTACLRALENRSRRPLPSGLGAPDNDPEQPLTDPVAGVSWLQPMPDAMIQPERGDPAAVVANRGSLRLALIAAMQHLPAKQRAVLILRDVLALRATEVAELLDTTTTAVNSALQRARAQLEVVALVEDEVAEAGSPGISALIDQYVAAFEEADIATLIQLLRKDVVLEMPPYARWFLGSGDVVRFIALQCLVMPGKNRLLRTVANGQPALAAYGRGNDGVYRAEALHVLSVTPTGISRIVAFFEPSLFPAFGLPSTLDSGRATVIR